LYGFTFDPRNPDIDEPWVFFGVRSKDSCAFRGRFVTKNLKITKGIFSAAYDFRYTSRGETLCFNFYQGDSSKPIGKCVYRNYREDFECDSEFAITPDQYLTFFDETKLLEVNGPLKLLGSDNHYLELTKLVIDPKTITASFVGTEITKTEASPVSTPIRVTVDQTTTGMLSLEQTGLNHGNRR
jgi:hypothetical protein